MPFVLERSEERTVFNFFNDFYGNAAGDVHTTEREHLERQVARLGAIDGNPQIQRLHAYGTRLREAKPRNLRRRIHVRILERSVLHVRREKFVQRAETPTG